MAKHMANHWTFVIWFERIAIPIVVIGGCFLLLVAVNKLPFDEGTQSAVLGFASAYIAYLLMQTRKEIKARRAVSEGLQGELLRLHALVRTGIGGLNHNLHSLFYPHVAMFSPGAVNKLTQLISDIDAFNTLEKEQADTDAISVNREQLRKRIDDTLAVVAILC